jgi:hypothetical protein
MDVTAVAVDLAKEVFQVALANRAERVVDRVASANGTAYASSMVAYGRAPGVEHVRHGVGPHCCSGSGQAWP